jgi:hypothetical protein
MNTREQPGLTAGLFVAYSGKHLLALLRCLEQDTSRCVDTHDQSLTASQALTQRVASFGYPAEARDQSSPDIRSAF